MPDVASQADMVLRSQPRALVARWMLHRGFAYEAARERYAPFDRLIDPDPTTREAIAQLIAGAALPAFVIINNKAEGSAPRSVVELATRIAELPSTAPVE